jgi:mannose-6-phosphate isomerase-like protein (cupin superfamily)
MDFDFPGPIKKLPLADVPLKGCTAYLSQHDDHQILFMKFEETVDLPEHLHRAQWGIVLSGKVELRINGGKHIYTKGDNYFIQEGVAHSGRIYAGYADVTYFDEKSRYVIKTKK